MDYTKAEAKRAARDRFTGLWAAITVPFDDAGEDPVDRQVAGEPVQVGAQRVLVEGAGSPRWWSNGRGDGARCSRTPGSTAQRRRSR